MADNSRPSIKNEKTYESLRESGYPKEVAARIANAQANDDQNPSKKGGEAKDYEDWNKDKLYQRAKELDITRRSGMTKSELIEALRDQREE